MVRGGDHDGVDRRVVDESAEVGPGLGFRELLLGVFEAGFAGSQRPARLTPESLLNCCMCSLARPPQLIKPRLIEPLASREGFAGGVDGDGRGRGGEEEARLES